MSNVMYREDKNKIYRLPFYGILKAYAYGYCV